MANAVFSPCRTWRYQLTRVLPMTVKSVRLSTVAFIGLNPSTADERIDDPTVRRCVRFAERWGFERMVMLNLFAFRSTDPKALYKQFDPVGPDNDEWIERTVRHADLVVAAWGNHGDLAARGEQVMHNVRAIKSVHVLAMNASGHPKHPLYIRADAEPTQLWP